MKIFIALLASSLLLFSFNKKKKDWVAIGDSITYLNDHPDETGNRTTKGYLTLVTQKNAGIRYINKGYNGWTAGDIARDIDKLGLTKADLYSVFLGTNDWWQGRPVGSLDDYKQNRGNNSFYGSFRIILDKLKVLNPKAKILLVTPLQRGDFVYLSSFKNNAHGSYKENKGQSLEQFADALLAIGKEEKLTVIDLYHNSGITPANAVKFKRLRDPANGKYRDFTYPEYVSIPFNPETDEYPYPPEAIDMTYDGLHPSDAGNERIAAMFLKVMDR